MMLKNMKFGTKLLVAFLVVGIIPAAVIGVISLNQTSKALSKAAFEKLEAVQRLKNTGVESFIKYVNRDINDLSHRKSLHKLYDELKKYHDERGFTATSAFDVSAPAYKAIYDNHIGYFKKLMEERGYYDIFLICAAHGHVMCTVARESDLGENLGTGPLKDSGLARLWRNVVKKKGICFEDFSPYAPSNNEPAAFMGEPIFDENERIIGVVAIQVSIDKINELMHNRTGMGKTGEIYLVGTDKLMRSDSYLDPVNHTVKASFANPSKGSVDTEASREALAGNKGKKIIIDYNGNPVLSVYSPLDIFGTRWACIAEIDEAEAFSAIKSIRWLMGIVFIISIAAIIGVGLFLARSIVKPVKAAVGRLKDISEGEWDLTKRLEVKSRDEIGELVKWINTFLEKLQGIIKDMAGNAETVSSSSTELTAISQQMSAGSEQTSGKANTVATASEEMSSNMTSVSAAAEEASTNLGMVATAFEEMTSVINEIARNTEKAQLITGEAVSEAKSASDKVDELGKAAQEIGKVTETITDISEQTNLLALNATIEAARAGEAGKGFAVVANEIKELAKQTADATGEIKNRITGIQDSTEGTVTQIEQISKVVNDVNEIVSTIATAVEEQSVTSKEIANNVGEASQGIQEVTENVAQSSTVAGEIAKDIAEVNQASNEMLNSSSKVNMSAGEQSKLAEQLKEIVGKFRV